MKKFLLSIIAVFVFILTFKMFLGYFFTPSTSGLTGLFREKTVNYLFIGSSQTRQGYDPKILNDSLKNAYILAYNGNDFFFTNFLIGQIIKQNKTAVKNIVMEAYPYRAYAKPALADVRIFNELNFSGKMQFLRYSQGILSIANDFNLLLSSGNEGILTTPVLFKLHNSFSYKGGYVGKTAGGLSDSAFWKLSPPYNDSVVYEGLDTTELTSLNNIINTCRANNINLIFLQPPVPQPILQSSLFIKAQTDLKAYITKYRLRYIDNDDFKFNNSNPALFHDAVHLSTYGREVFTKAVTKFVEQ